MSSVAKESKLLAKHTLIYGIGSATNKIVAFLLLPLYTRYLTPHDYGIKELVGITSDVIGILIATAISSAFYRFYFEQKDEEYRNMVLSSSYIFLGGFGLFFVLLLLLASPLFAKYILDSSTLAIYFYLSFTSMWFQILNGIGFDYLRANLLSLKYIILTIIKLLLTICLNIYFIVFLHMGILGILVSTLISSILLFFALNVPQLYRIGLRFSSRIIKEMFQFGYPVIIAQLSAFVVHISDRFFLKAYCSITDAGLYSLGYRFGTIPGSFISEPFNQVWQPRRLEIYKQPNAEEMFGRIFTYFLLLISFVGLAVAVAAKDLLMIMSAESFWSAYKVVPVIVIANMVFTFSYHFNIGIVIAKKTKYLAYINFSNAAIILLLNFILIPRYGIWGAAYATLLAFIYKSGLTFYFSNKIFKIHFEAIRIIKMILAAVVIYLSAYWVVFNSVYIDFLVKLLIACLYPAVLYWFGFFTREEINKVKGFLIPRIRSIIHRK